MVVRNVRLDTPRFLFVDVSNATGVALNTMQGWLNRKAATFSKFDLAATGRGSRHILTLRSAYNFALASRMIVHGFSPLRAFENLKKVVWKGPRSEDARNEDTLLYDIGDTFLFVYTDFQYSKEYLDQNTEEETLFKGNVNVAQVGSAGDLRKALFDLDKGNSGVVTVIDCKKILSEVDRILEVPQPQRR
jgi:hypothetical protein